jgi:MoaA/NifB/PqqE/SkfB family radical SAM enzyme
MLLKPPVTQDHFVMGLGPAAARRLFKQYVTYVNVETFSYCNRKCWFCANSFLDRHSANQIMEDAFLGMIVRDLAEIDFDGTVNLNGYNEPLADDIIFEHIHAVRTKVPRARISIFSSGDFLTRERLERLHEVGLNELRLSIHTGNNEDLNDAKVEKRIQHYEEKLGLDVRMQKSERGVRYKGQIDFRDMFIRLYEPNMRTLGSDMGGLIEGVETKHRRVCPCLEPAVHLTVEFDGSVVPCCRIRTDAPQHKDLAICSLRDVSSIFEAYVHPKAVAWRRSLSTFGEKQSPCATCDNALIKDTVVTRAKFHRVERMLKASA